MPLSFSQIDEQSYEAFFANSLQSNLWQSLEWKTYQEAIGREVRLYGVRDEKNHIRIAALVSIDRTIGGLSVWDMPRGPLWKEGISDEQKETFINGIIEEAKKDKCMSLYISPLQPLSTLHNPLSTSKRHEQPEATRILDLTLSDDDLLKQMKPKGRYNIRLAEKNGVTVQQSDDIDIYYTLATETGTRDRFGIPPKKNLKAFLEHIPNSFLLLAYPPNPNPSPNPNPITGLIGTIHNQTGIYYYGASSANHRSLMSPYLLQWHAMQHCKKLGCTSYDLLGIAPSPASASHPWSGISVFKAKFGGEEVLYPPEQEICLMPFWKMVIGLKRRIM